MRILDRYLLRQYIINFFVILLSFSVIIIVIDVFDRLPRILKHTSDIMLITQFFILRIPYLFVLTSPIVVLLSGLFLMNNLSKYNETIATRAAGISIFRMMVPLMIMGLFICGLIAFFGEYVLPIAENKRTIIFNVNIRQREVEDIKMRSNIFYSDDKYIYYLGFFDGYQNRIRVVDITQRDENNLIVRKIQANEAIWIDDHIYPDTKVWNFINVYDRHFSEGELLAYTFFDEKTFPEVTVTPQDFIKSAKKPMEMNYIELRDYINRLKKIGDKSHREETDLHYKISFPLANFIILLFCVPLATASIRSKGRGMIFLMGILICFAYLMVIRLCLSLGYSEIITPLQAAWAPHILFFLVGVFFVIKAEI